MKYIDQLFYDGIDLQMQKICNMHHNYVDIYHHLSRILT